MCDFHCYCCGPCNCCSKFIRMFIGKFLVFIFSLGAILLGIFTIWQYYGIGHQAIFKITMQIYLANTIKALGIGLGIAMIIYGIAGIFGLIYRKKSSGKVILFIYLIGSFLVFLFMVVIGSVLAHEVSSAVYDYYGTVCHDDHKPSVPVIMYDIIKESTKTNTSCPSDCAGNVGLKSKELMYCPTLSKELNLPIDTFKSSYFYYLKELESTFHCAGMCTHHDRIPCTYFSDFSQKSAINCIDYIKDNLSKYNTIIIVIFCITLPVSIFNMLAAICLICESKEDEKLIKT